MLSRQTFKLFMTTTLLCVASVPLSACVHPELISDSAKMTQGTGTPVLAVTETTAVGTVNLDSADDPEIWVDPSDSNRVVIYGTDKKAGLYSYDLNGKVIDFLTVGPMNNVDLRNDALGLPVVVAASDRIGNGVRFFKLDPATLKTTDWGFASLATSEAYGFCLGKTTAGDLVAIMVGKNGDVAQATVSVAAGKPVLSETRRFNVGTQSEGCVVDDVNQTLYIAEENAGIWMYSLDPATGPQRKALASLPSDVLKADVEGLTLLRDGQKTYLIASSQGDSAFAVWRVEGSPVYQGRFSVFPGSGIDAVTGTDGVAALGGQVGPYTKGIVVMQDDMDTEGEALSTTRARQNFKIVDWKEIEAKLSLK
ncbi:3-phytase [Asticcacaulis excentricus CB 48]|uniref:3-phytase n=1 Tax=Asticcacaulis excentricus (strain ATCC 15261 / DSM 4724 / KCTC 12464 / NCIMB 9791 / VKM B-1370 / CB 48) TaxID=573065 RepID=E8RML6_ASTEC|nr:3-phytase [Asticcacaulis excentricus CB 48]